MARPPRGITLHRAEDGKVEMGRVGIITLVVATGVDILIAGMSAARVFQLNKTELGLAIVAAEEYLHPLISTFTADDDSLSTESSIASSANNYPVRHTSETKTHVETQEQIETYDSLADDEELNHQDVIKSSHEDEIELVNDNITRLIADIANNPDNKDGLNKSREESLVANRTRLARLQLATGNVAPIPRGRSSSARSRAKR